MNKDKVFNKVLIPENKTAVKVTLKEMPDNSFIGYIEGYIPTNVGIKVSVVVCDLGALTCVDIDEIQVLNKDDHALKGYTAQLSFESVVKLPSFIS